MKKYIIMAIGLLIITYICFPTFYVTAELKENNSEKSIYSSIYSTIENQFIIEVDNEDFEMFSYNFPIFGYKLIANDINPFDWDTIGVLTLSQNTLDYVNISLKLECRDYHYFDIPILGQLYIDRHQNRLFIYTIEDYHQGFFMEIVIMAQRTYINLAFDGEFCQLCYEGLVPEGYFTINPYLTQIIKANVLDVDNLLNPELHEMSFTQLETKLKTDQRNNIHIYHKQPQEVSTSEATTSSSVTLYGVAHEKADHPSVNLAEQLGNNYWIPYSEIEVGVYRRKPSEAQIKSDLQYYNKDIYYSPQNYVIRDIKAYAIYAHGSNDHPGHETSWVMVIEDDPPFRVLSWLDPYEISNLWYNYYDPGSGVEEDVHAFDMIIHATVCYGYAVTTSGDPKMAKAFVNDGYAAAFVGATVSIPTLHNDQFTKLFWRFLCQNDRTVKKATQKYVWKHNYYDDYPGDLNIDWIYGTHIKIYGNVNVLLDN